MLRILFVLFGFIALVVVGLMVLAAGAIALGIVVGTRRLRARLAAFKFARLRDTDPADPLDAAWTRAAHEADWAVSRIATARSSCARLIALADADPLAADAVDWANVVRRRVPDLVAACLDECADATPAERRSNLEDLVDSLEKIGAEAERRRDRFRGAKVSAFHVQRAYVDARTRQDPLG
ncbi:hypothetical protein [Sphingomonas sp.]|uniref:hypothetical protein n=1 Tax=Sphingomonas sp. TaxID=28214 RepID=UPI001EC3FE44|nr:hypothetical protein [Sphingomonas sp.]MBX3595807.1 hypothetical protein [Sphingomonas sp.]